jgi:hypothetical protein
MLFRAATAATFLLAVLSCTAAEAATYLDPGLWRIGPVIGGVSRSRGMPLHPSPGPGRGFQIHLPPPSGSLNYVTFRHGSLTAKSRIVMRYRVEAAPGVRIVPRTAPQLPSVITLYFQRAGDNWSGRGPFEAFRWYATFASQSPVAPGSH